jgi:formamidopyrimidine-DNA glycosylase
MLEIPELSTISPQAAKALTGKKIKEVANAASPYKFAWYNGDHTEYRKLLVGRVVESAKGHGMFVDIIFDNDTYLSVGDGTIIRYGDKGEKRPDKHQLLVGFEDGSFLVFTVAMYGSTWAFKGIFDNKYYQGSLNSISPLENAFNKRLFDNVFKNSKKDLSVKALLATEQRIP